MGDFDFGYENGLWGADGIPYWVTDDFPSKSRWVSPVKLGEEFEAYAKDLIQIRLQIEALREKEKSLKGNLKSLMPLFSYIETNFDNEEELQSYKIIRKKQRKPQAFRSYNYVEKYIRSTYGHKIADDIVINCTKNMKPIDTVFIYKTKKFDDVDEKVKAADPGPLSDFDDDIPF